MLQQKVFGKRENGFSLVELMVGLVIGLFATLVIMQVFSVFEGQKRTTSGTADAQTNGTIALMQLQRHLQTAGYGMPMAMADFDNNILKCDSAAGAAAFPIMIVDGANGNAGDSIVSRYSVNTSGGGAPITITNINNSAPNGMGVSNNIGCGSDREMTALKYNATYQDLTDTTLEAATQPENTVMIMRGNQCGTAVIAKQPVNTAAAVATDADSSYIKLVADPVGLTLPLTTTDKLSCMGGYGDHTLGVNAATNELRLNNNPIVAEVVSMQAQYGVSNSAEINTVTAWVDATGGTWAAPTRVDRNRIKAVRIAIALRNGLKEKTQVTPNAALSWTGTDGTTLTLSVAHLPDWGNYRYRVFGTTVPLRNMIWSREAI